MEVGIKSELDLTQQKLQYMHHLHNIPKSTSGDKYKMLITSGTCSFMEKDPVILAFRTLVVELAPSSSKDHPVPWNSELDGHAETLASFLSDVQPLISPTYAHAKLVSKELKLDITLCVSWRHTVLAYGFVVNVGTEVKKVENGSAETCAVPSVGLNALRKQVGDMHTAWAKLPQ
jgi:hypothetical protein